jgi:hypothetical protein
MCSTALKNIVLKDSCLLQLLIPWKLAILRCKLSSCWVSVILVGFHIGLPATFFYKSDKHLTRDLFRVNEYLRSLVWRTLRTQKAWLCLTEWAISRAKRDQMTLSQVYHVRSVLGTTHCISRLILTSSHFYWLSFFHVNVAFVTFSFCIIFSDFTNIQVSHPGKCTWLNTSILQNFSRALGVSIQIISTGFKALHWTHIWTLNFSSEASYTASCHLNLK